MTIQYMMCSYDSANSKLTIKVASFARILDFSRAILFASSLSKYLATWEADDAREAAHDGLIVARTLIGSANKERERHAHAHTYTHTHVHTHIHANTHTHAHTHARTHTNTHTHAHAHTNACTHTLTHTENATMYVFTGSESRMQSAGGHIHIHTATPAAGVGE